MPEQFEPSTFGFLRDGSAEPMKLAWPDDVPKVRAALGEALNARHVAFLLGAGCSSKVVGGTELGIPTMAPLAKEFCGASQEAGDYEGGKPPSWVLNHDEVKLLGEYGVYLKDADYTRNLERLLEALQSLRMVLYRSTNDGDDAKADAVDVIIGKVKSFLWGKCSSAHFGNGDSTVLSLYETFYRKLVLRDQSLPRPWVFTTNYDAFNEQAMDRLGLPYTNGFSGVIERRFNPAMFRYALAEQLDLSNRKWNAVDGFVYLAKLHGSMSWVEDGPGLFPIREIWPPQSGREVMIYPTPSKQGSSFGSPYADIFREFQGRVVREQSVLITCGYAFGDEHLNKLIYQGLTIPTFRLIIFADPLASGEIGKLRDLRDPRVWIIGGNGAGDQKVHYFDHLVEHFMPQPVSDRIESAIHRVSEALGDPKNES